MEVKSKKLPKSQIELEFELKAEEFLEHFEHALGHLKSHIKVEGFRPGHAPAKMAEEKIKPEALLMEAGEHAVKHVYSDYVLENDLEPVGHPEVKIKKIAKGSEFIFTATITVLPKVELPDYKKIAASVKDQSISVTEDEVQDSLNYLQKTRAKFTMKNGPAEKKDFVEIEYSCKEIDGGKTVKDQFILGEGGLIKGFEDNLVGMKAGEEKIFTLKFPEKSPLAGKEGEFRAKIISVQKMELPEISDEFAKQLGAFDTLAVLKTSIKEGLLAEKTEAEKQRKRAEILEKITEKTKLELPDVMVEYEEKKLLQDLKDKITQTFSVQGGPASGWEQYLAAVKRTEDEIKKTFEKEAEKRLRGFLVLREIGKTEKVEVLDAEVEEEVKKLKVDNEQVREYTKGVLFNEKVFQLLE